MAMENTKNLKDDQSGSNPSELSEEELKVLSAGSGSIEKSVNEWIDEKIRYLDPSAWANVYKVVFELLIDRITKLSSVLVG